MVLVTELTHLEVPVGFNKRIGFLSVCGSGESLPWGTTLELEKEAKCPNNGRVGPCRPRCQHVARD